jgi:hypothetical protein
LPELLALVRRVRQFEQQFELRVFARVNVLQGDVMEVA